MDFQVITYSPKNSPLFQPIIIENEGFDLITSIEEILADQQPTPPKNNNNNDDDNKIRVLSSSTTSIEEPINQLSNVNEKQTFLEVRNELEDLDISVSIPKSFLNIPDHAFYTKSFVDYEKSIPETSITCVKCGDIFPTTDDKNQHVRHRHHFPGWFCPCDMTFQQLSHFLNHSCEYKLKNSFIFNKMADHFINDEEIWQCRVCKQFFFSEKVLPSHMLECRGEGRNECCICNVDFGYFGTLRSHYNKCRDKLCSEMQALVEYLALHKEICEVHCKYCSKSFSTNDLGGFKSHVMQCVDGINCTMLESVELRFAKIRDYKTKMADGVEVVEENVQTEFEFSVVDSEFEVKVCDEEIIDFDNLLPNGVVNPPTTYITVFASPSFEVTSIGEEMVVVPVVSEEDVCVDVCEEEKENDETQILIKGTPIYKSTILNKNLSLVKQVNSDDSKKTTSSENETPPSCVGGLEKYSGKRKRKLVIDKYTDISRDEMMAQIANTADTVTAIDLAPPTKQALNWRNTGGVERLFARPGRQMNCKVLLQLFYRHLTTRPEETQDFTVPDATTTNFGSPTDSDTSEPTTTTSSSTSSIICTSTSTSQNSPTKPRQKTTTLQQKLKGTALPSADHRYTNTVLVIGSHEMNSRTCDKCGEVFATPLKKKNHVIERSHFDGWYCYPCQRRFSELNNFWAHGCLLKKRYSYSFINWNDCYFNNQEVWQCGICKQLFFSEGVLHHHISDCALVCKFCGARFLVTDDFRIHFDLCRSKRLFADISSEEIGNESEILSEEIEIVEEIPTTMKISDPRTSLPRFQPRCVINRLDNQSLVSGKSILDTKKDKNEEFKDGDFQNGGEAEDDKMIEMAELELKNNSFTQNNISDECKIDSGDFYSDPRTSGTVPKVNLSKICDRCGHAFPNQYFDGHPCDWLMKYLTSCRVEVKDVVKMEIKKESGRRRQNWKSFPSRVRCRRKGRTKMSCCGCDEDCNL